MKILLTGKNGQLGFELMRALAPLGQVFATNSQELNLADAGSIKAYIQRLQPDIIVNPAAYTAVDKAESEPELAHAINAVAPQILAEEAAKLGALLVHYSTDYVFDGSKAEGAYSEEDTTGPLNQYGLTKLAGEQAIQAANAKHLIFRTSWVLGAHGNNFAKTMLRLAKERDQLNIVADQWGAPTSASLIADVTAHVIRQYQQAQAQTTAEFPYGLYHLVAAGETNWQQYARHVIAYAEQQGQHFKIAAQAIEPISTSSYPTPAQRPLNSRLLTHKLQRTFNLHLPEWQQGVNHILDQIL